MAASLLSARPVASRPARRARTAAPCRAQLLNEVAQLASDSRPLILLGLGAPVLGYVAYQLESMVEPASSGKAATKRRSLVAGLTALSASALAAANDAAQAAQEVVQLAGDNRPFVLLGLGLPVLGYVAFQIGLPALRQLQGMLEEKPAAGKKAPPKRK